jgi:hypothetical protein
VFTENIEAVKQHIAAGTDVNAKSSRNGSTPLAYAAYKGRKEIVELLIAAGADVNAKVASGPKQGLTPLDAANETNHTEIAALLRKHGGKTGKELKGGEPVVKAAKPEPPTVEELLNSIGTPLNEMEKIISDEKYLEKLVDDDSDAPIETINRANHTYSILYINGEERTLVHGVWMIKDNNFYYMEVVDGGMVIPEEEREVVSCPIISLERDKIQLYNDSGTRLNWTKIYEFKEKEMQSYNKDQVNKNFNVFEKSH